MTLRSVDQLAPVVLATATLALVLGCHSLRTDVAALIERTAELPETVTDGAKGNSPDSGNAPPELSVRLDKDTWRSMPADSVRDGGYRWRHEEVEALAREAQQPDLAAVMSTGSPVARTNAAIVQVRRGDASMAAELAKLIFAPDLETNQRCAAVETLARLGPGAGGPVAALLADSPTSDIQPALEAELLQAAGVCHVEVSEARLERALQSKSPEVRAAALRYHAAMARRLSQRGLDLRTDPDPNVRLCWIDAIAAGAGGSAAAELGKCLRDPDLRLRLATVRALGSVHGDQSQALLRTQLKDPGELIRSAAVTSLARLNDERAVLGAADDPSWRVRKAVAESLATFPTRQASVVAERLLVDQSPDVEVAVVDAVGAWPLERAGNLLLMACSQTALATRERAADHLSKQWPPAGDFSPTAPPERRAEVLDELRAAWAAEFGEIDRSLLAQTTPQRVPAVAPMPHLDEIRVLVTELATQRSTEVQRRQLARLRGYDRELIPALEYLATVERLHLIDAIYHDALPQIDPAFRLLMSMESADLQTRREASGRLATLAADTSLRPLVLLRLSQRVPHEADGVVWINVWRMIEHDAREPSLRIAYAALGHSEVEVRLKACEYLAAHPAREHAPFLTATLADKSPNVARAAAAALGRCGPLEDLSGLTSALAARDPGLRLAAAVSLAQLGSEEGRVALERFTYEGDSDLRRSSAVAIGTLGDREFIPALIRLLDDRDNVRRAALEALVQITGGDVAERPGEPPASLPERAQRWKQWWAAQNQDSVPQP